MGEPETVIDLDLHPDSRSADGRDVLDSHPRRSGPRTVAGWWQATRAGRAARWRQRLWWVAAVTTCGVLLAATGAAAPSPPTIVEIMVLKRTLDNTWHHDGRLIVMEAGKISAYDPDSGTVLWTATVPGAGEYMGAEVAGPWLLINQPEDDPDEPGNVIVGAVDAHDLRTGQLVPTQLHGWPRTLGDLLLLYDDRGGKAAGSPVLRFHDLHSLDPLWSRSVATLRAWSVSPDGRVLYTLADDLLEEFDARTGLRLRSAALHVAKSDWMHLEATDERLILQSGTSSATENDGPVKIDTDLWIDRATMRVTPSRPYRMEQPCGELVCGAVEGPDMLRTVVLDPVTGARLWEVPDSSALATSPAGLLRGTALSRFEQFGRPTLLGLVDPRTGEISVPVPEGWVLVLDRLNTPDRFLMSGRFALTRPDPAQRPSFLGEITPYGLRQLGSLGFPAEHCESFDSYLLCHDVTGYAHLLRVNR